MFSRAYLGIGTVASRSQSSSPGVISTVRDSVFCKLCLYEPLPLTSPLLSSIGSVRTKRRLKSTKRPKFPEYQLDKRFPFNYTLRVLPTVLTSPGDRDKTLGYIDKSKYKLYYGSSEELKTASEEVKKVFKLELGTQKDIFDVKRAEMIEKVQRHELDYNSEEVVIAKRTVQIRQYFEKLNAKPHDKILRARLNSIVGNRNRLLNELRRKDENRFRWLVKTLEIDHDRPLLGVTIHKPDRNSEVTRLTDEYCQRIRGEKIEAYKKELKAEQVLFKEEKKTAEEWIAQQEKEISDKQQQLKEEEEMFWKRKNCRET